MMCVVKGVELLISEFESEGSTDGFLSVTIALMFFFTVYVLEMVGKGVWFRPHVRAFLSDYAYPVSFPTDYKVYVSFGQLIQDLDRSPRYSGRALRISQAS